MEINKKISYHIYSVMFCNETTMWTVFCEKQSKTAFNVSIVLTPKWMQNTSGCLKFLQWFLHSSPVAVLQQMVPISCMSY